MIENPNPGDPERPEIEPDPPEREPGPDGLPPPAQREPEPDDPEAEPPMWAPGADDAPAARAPGTRREGAG